MPRLRLHGPPVVAADDARLVALSAREAALLAWLHLEGPTPRARLAGLLWPGGSEAQARANLRQLLARLRRGAGALVAEDGGVMRLSVDLLPPAQPGDTLLAGMHFDDLPDVAQWLSTRRDAAGRQLQRAQLLQGQASLDRGDLDAALAAADALLALQPESEEAWRLRMLALHQRGDRAAAIAAWDACKDALRSAFGVAPSAATNELGRLILAGDAAPPAPSRHPTALPPALRRPPQLVGRDTLLADLGRLLALGRSAVVAGPGGIGKSRVLQQAAAGLEPVLRVQARPGDAVLAGGLLAQILKSAFERFRPPLDDALVRDLARLLPELFPGAAGPADATADAVRSELEHRRVMGAVCRACQLCGLRLLVVDDLQYADDASLAVLQFVVGRWLSPPDDDPGAVVQVLLSARPQELSAAGQALVQAVAGHAGGHLFEIAPLTAAEVHALVDRLPLPDGVAEAWGADGRQALAGALHGGVGGNPAFVLEALRTLFLDGFAAWQPGRPLPVPATLRDSVRHRVQHLPPEALQLAQLAAVAQGDFDTALAARAFGRTPLALAPLFAALESAQVFHGTQFSHDLMAEAVHGLVPQALRQPLHQLVAEHLQQHSGAEARVAHHLVAAGQPRAAAPWLAKAAQAARRRWRLADAAAAFEAAARGHDPVVERAQAFDAWCDALRCWIDLRRRDATAAALAAAAPLARGVCDDVRLHARAVHHCVHAGQMGAALPVAARLVDELAGLTDAPTADALPADELVYALRAACYAVQGGLPAARVLALCERWQPQVAQAGGEALAGLALARATTLLWDSAEPQEALHALEAVWPLLDDASDPFLRRSVLNQRMRVHQALGDADRAVALGQTLLGWQQDGTDDTGLHTDVLHLVALMQVAQGEVAAGMAHVDRLWRQQAGGSPLRPAQGMALALACIAVGRHADAQAWLDRHARPPGRAGHAMDDLVQALAGARLAAAQGAPVAPWLAQLRAAAPLPAGGVLYRQVALAGLEPQPLHALQALRAALQQRGQRGLLRSVEIAAARAALAAADLPAAAGHARAALALAGCVNAWSDEPAALWLTAFEVLQACGARDEARAALADGLAWVAQGSGQWAEPAHRSAWRDGHPLHRRLLQHAAEQGLL